MSLARHLLNLERALRAAADGDLGPAQAFVAGGALGIQSPLELDGDIHSADTIGGKKVALSFTPQMDFRLLEVCPMVISPKECHFKVNVRVGNEFVSHGAPGREKLELQYDRLGRVGLLITVEVTPLFVEGPVEVVVGCLWKHCTEEVLATERLFHSGLLGQAPLPRLGDNSDPDR